MTTFEFAVRLAVLFGGVVLMAWAVGGFIRTRKPQKPTPTPPRPSEANIGTRCTICGGDHTHDD